VGEQLREKREKIETNSNRSGLDQTRSLGGMMERERRRTPRYMFFASAELLEERSDVRIATRVSELSRNGCYLDMMNPFPMHTVVRVKIWTEENIMIETKACVVYSQMNRGAGLSFVDMDPKHLPLLDKWLAKAEKDS
jgi:hypothetical protein